MGHQRVPGPGGLRGGRQLERDQESRAAAVAAAADWAEIAEMLGDYHDAVGWLNLIKTIEGGLSQDLAERRQALIELAEGRGLRAQGVRKVSERVGSTPADQKI
jgi:hypothetical protein